MKCFAGLVQGAEPEIVAALDVDRGEVHAGRRIGQEVAQAVDNAGVDAPAPDRRRGAAGSHRRRRGIEIGGFHEEHMRSSISPLVTPRLSTRSVSSVTMECPNR